MIDEAGHRDRRWQEWRAARPEPQGLHLDSAAAGRSSLAVLDTVSAHARLEARAGGYVAQEMAADALLAARTDLAGLLGTPAEGVAFVESATVALSTVLEVWPFGPDPTIAVAPSEWGPNLVAFARHGLRVVPLAAHGDGSIDLDALARQLATAPPSAVHVTQVASHRPLVQPVAEIAALCRAAAVALFVDAAQALGHVDTATGADVVYATSRKWLAGPRGVGVLAVSGRWFGPLRSFLLAREPDATDETVGALLTSREAHVSGRLGLGQAAREHLGLGPSDVWERLADVGRATRQVLDDLTGWQVVAPAGDPSAITALTATGGQDVMEVRGRLLREHGIVTTAQQLFRAPNDMVAPTLRISPHVDCTVDDLVRMREILGSL